MQRPWFRFTTRRIMAALIVLGMVLGVVVRFQRQRERAAEAAYLNAKLTREVAEIAVVEYVEGIFKQEMETAKGEIALAQSNLKLAEDRYVSHGKLIPEAIAVQKAKFELEQAQTKQAVLEKYTRGKTVAKLKSEVQKARSDERAKEAIHDRERAALSLFVK